jgi:hypothetical protein
LAADSLASNLIHFVKIHAGVSQPFEGWRKRSMLDRKKPSKRTDAITEFTLRELLVSDGYT